MSLAGPASVPGDFLDDVSDDRNYTTPEYSFIICDPTTGQPIDELVSPSDVSFSYLMNKPGSFTCSVSKYSLKPDGANRFSYSSLLPGTLALYVKRNEEVVWGGLIWSVQTDSKSPVINITAIGWWEYFRHLRIGTLEITAAQTAREIIPQIFAAVGAFSPYRNVAYSYELRGEAPSFTTGFSIRASEYRMAADAFDSLMNSNARCDVSFLYDDTGAAITPRFVFTIPYILNNRFNILEYVVDDSGSSVGNIAGYSLTFDGSKMANVVTGLGTTANNFPLPRPYVANYLVDQFGLATGYREAPYDSPLKNIGRSIPVMESVYRRTEIISALSLQAATERYMRVSAQPPAQIRTEMVPGSIQPTFISPGDACTVRISDGFAQLNETLRCVQVAIKLGDGYIEQVSIELAPPDY